MAEIIAEGIFKLNIPLPDSPLKNLNSYLIRGRERNLLIDTGFNTPACLSAMTSELKRLSVDMDQTDIFLTHMHTDHSGLAPELASEGTKTYISAIDAAYLDARKLPEARDELVAMYILEGFPYEEVMRSIGSHTAKKMTTVKPMAYSRLEDGDVLSYGGYELQCILTPGHSPGHLCLYCAELKLMVLGDHVLFGITPNIVRWADFDNSLKTYLEQLERIAQYDIDIALPAHRDVSGTVAARCLTIAGHHKKRLDEVYGILLKNPGMTAYDVAGHMRWQIRCASWADFPPSQKWFAVGEALAHLDYLLAAGDIAREEKNGVRFYYPAKK